MWEKIYLAGLHYLWFTHKKLFSTFEKHRNYKDFFEKLDFNILKNIWYKDEQISIIINRKKSLDLEKLYKIISKLDVDIICYWEEKYPVSLTEIPNKPFLFYLRWELDKKDCFAIVWTRKITSYWEKVIEKIVPDLAKYFIIVSWWAAWCDTKAHKETIRNWWKTISVLWTWIDVNYPTENKLLYDKIVEKWWAVMSIFPIWTFWSNYTFPIRNEIVAWLVKWTLIIEAEEKSGSLITAKLTLDLWRDLFSVPWDIFSSMSVWTNNLILSWEAKITTKSFDIFEEYNISVQNKPIKNNILFDDEIEKSIYELLSLYSLSNDEIMKKVKIDSIWFLNLKLSMMELKWIIRKNKLSKYELM